MSLAAQDVGKFTYRDQSKSNSNGYTVAKKAMKENNVEKVWIELSSRQSGLS